jgi:hypothetical protein
MSSAYETLRDQLVAANVRNVESEARRMALEGTLARVRALYSRLAGEMRAAGLTYEQLLVLSPATKGLREALFGATRVPEAPGCHPKLRERIAKLREERETMRDLMSIPTLD